DQQKEKEKQDAVSQINLAFKLRDLGMLVDPQQMRKLGKKATGGLDILDPAETRQAIEAYEQSRGAGQPAAFAQLMGGPQSLRASPNSVTGTGKALQNPTGMSGVTPTTPAGSGTVEKGATGTLINPSLMPETFFDRNAAETWATQHFGIHAKQILTEM